MIEILFSSGIALAVFLIFKNLPSMEQYSEIFFWLFIAVIILFGIVALIKAVFAIKDTVASGKTNARKKK